MTWIEKHKGFIRFVYRLMLNYGTEDVEETADAISSVMGNMSDFKYSDHRLRRRAIEVVKSLEN